MDFNATYTVKMSVGGLNGELETEIIPSEIYELDEWEKMDKYGQQTALENYAQDELMQDISIWLVEGDE